MGSDAQEMTDAVLPPAQRTTLDAQVEAFLARLEQSAPGSAGFDERVRALATLGDDEVAAAGAVSARVLAASAGTTRRGLAAGQDRVSGTLESLRSIIEDLDPARAGDLLAPRKLLGLVPLGDRLQAYFSRYRQAQAQLRRILDALAEGRDALARETAGLETEQADLRGVIDRLRQYAYVLGALDGRVETLAAQADVDAPSRAAALRDPLLLTLRQRHTDLLTQLAVSAQGALGLAVIRGNQRALIDGIDRATTTTLDALRVAMSTAFALTRQRLVLDEIRAIGDQATRAVDTAGALSTGQGQAAAQDRVAAEKQIDTLRDAFADARAALDILEPAPDTTAGIPVPTR